jgi:3-methyladenine DNA glycosylase/8-oxoguanine DNA glycosylase
VTAPTIELRLRGPGGEPVDLWRTLVSHGFAELAPMSLDEAARTLELTLRIPRGRPRRIRIRAGRRDRARIELLGGAASDGVSDAVERGATHVLRLDQDLSSFYAVAADDPDLAWAALGAGRMLRSPTVWEDLVKTLCTTNCSWGLTTKMVHTLVRELGEPAVGFAREPLANAFPTSLAMAERDERFYRDVVRSGYRAPHMVRLSRMVADGEIDVERLGSASRDELPDEDVEALLLSLPGIGPYAAAHVMMTLGRNSQPILDSWTRPTYARATGRRRIPADATIERRFRRYAPNAGLAFWLFVTKDWVEEPAG